MAVSKQTLQKLVEKGTFKITLKMDPEKLKKMLFEMGYVVDLIQIKDEKYKGTVLRKIVQNGSDSETHIFQEFNSLEEIFEEFLASEDEEFIVSFKCIFDWYSVEELGQELLDKITDKAARYGIVIKNWSLKNGILFERHTNPIGLFMSGNNLYLPKEVHFDVADKLNDFVLVGGSDEFDEYEKIQNVGDVSSEIECDCNCKKDIKLITGDLEAGSVCFDGKKHAWVTPCEPKLEDGEITKTCSRCGAMSQFKGPRRLQNDDNSFNIKLPILVKNIMEVQNA